MFVCVVLCWTKGASLLAALLLALALSFLLAAFFLFRGHSLSLKTRPSLRGRLKSQWRLQGER